MTVHAQNSCTLSHITDVQAVYTYYYLASSDITSNMAPKDNVNAPGASTIRVTYNGVNYDWTLTEPTLNIVDDVIQTAVGKLYFMECTLFSDSTYDWGPLMTSSTYAAAKAAYNLSSQALANASAAKAVTDLMGGHFIYGNAIPNTSTSAGARVIEQIEEGGVDLITTPSKWHHNVNIGANGIQLRYNEAVMAQLAANQSGNDTALKFYKPPSVSGNTTTQGALAMELTSSDLKFYGSSSSTADATLASTGLVLRKGGITSGNPNTSGFVYVSSENYGTYQSFIDNYSVANDKADWKVIVGTIFGVDSGGYIYASGGKISGFELDGNSLHVGNLGASGSVFVCTGTNSPANIAGSGSISGWAFTAGNTFGVTNTGALYATGAHISGAITVSDTVNSNIYTTSRTDELLGDKASVNAEYSVEIITSNFNPTATAAATYITLTAKVTRTNGTALGNISYKWYGDNSSSVVLSTSSSYNVPANKVWNGTSGYKTFTVEIN